MWKQNLNLQVKLNDTCRVSKNARACQEKQACSEKLSVMVTMSQNFKNDLRYRLTVWAKEETVELKATDCVHTDDILL